MANPQLENGYTRIANELLVALTKIDMPPTCFRIALYVIRMTYGYGLKNDYFPVMKIAESIGIHRVVVTRNLVMLKKANIVVRDGQKIGIQKDFDKWDNVTARLQKCNDLVSSKYQNSYKKETEELHQENIDVTEELQKSNDPVAQKCNDPVSFDVTKKLQDTHYIKEKVKEREKDKKEITDTLSFLDDKKSDDPLEIPSDVDYSQAAPDDEAVPELSAGAVDELCAVKIHDPPLDIDSLDEYVKRVAKNYPSVDIGRFLPEFKAWVKLNDPEDLVGALIVELSRASVRYHKKAPSYAYPKKHCYSYARR